MGVVSPLLMMDHNNRNLTERQETWATVRPFREYPDAQVDATVVCKTTGIAHTYPKVATCTPRAPQFGSYICV